MQMGSLRRHGARAAVGMALGTGIIAATVVPRLSGSTAPEAATVSAARAQAMRTASCAHRLLKDWSDGRIDGSYPISCYRQAIAKLPADLLVYSTAEEDIRQALSERIARSGR
jgi:hypothetical protein